MNSSVTRAEHYLHTSIVILAGGQGRRMGGVEKGLLEFRRHPLIEHVLQRLKSQSDHILINANRNREDYAAYGYPVLEDAFPEGAGPLAGLLSAMQYSHSREYILCVPCDAPFIPLDLLERMYDALQQQDCEACSVHDGERLQAAFLLVRKSMASSLFDFLQGGDRKVGLWFSQLKHCTVDYSGQAEAFCNLNRPEDLQQWQ